MPASKTILAHIRRASNNKCCKLYYFNLLLWLVRPIYQMLSRKCRCVPVIPTNGSDDVVRELLIRTRRWVLIKLRRTVECLTTKCVWRVHFSAKIRLAWRSRAKASAGLDVVLQEHGMLQSVLLLIPRDRDVLKEVIACLTGEYLCVQMTSYALVIRPVVSATTSLSSSGDIPRMGILQQSPLCMSRYRSGGERGRGSSEPLPSPIGALLSAASCPPAVPGRLSVFQHFRFSGWPLPTLLHCSF